MSNLVAIPIKEKEFYNQLVEKLAEELIAAGAKEILEQGCDT